MAKKTPLTVASGYQSTTQLNAEFADIAEHFNDKVLYRDNPSGANQMENDLDMNSNDILNVASLDVAEFSIGGVAATVTAFEGSNIVKFYGTVANMKAATDLIVGDVVQTKGYTSAGDNGAALYRIVAAATGTADNGLYHDLTGITGQAELLYTDAINVLWFGADPTGVADSAAIFQAVHDSFGSEGGSIYVPTGVYLLDQTTVAAQFTINKSNINLYGDGFSSVLKRTSTGVVTGNQAIVQIYPDSGAISNITVRDLKILGPTTNTGAAISADNRVVCLMIHNGVSGISNTVSDVLIEGVMTQGSETAGFAINGNILDDGCVRIRFNECWSINHRQDGYNDFGGRNNEDITFSNCYALDCDGFGMEISTSKGVSITNNTVGRCGQAGISVQYDALTAPDVEYLISGNQIHDIGTVGYPDGSGIILGQTGVSINTLVSDNTITKIGGHGIWIEGSNNDNSIIGNVIHDVGGGGVSKIGIGSNGTGVNTLISDNRIKNNTAGYTLDVGISLAGVGSITNLIDGNNIQGESVAKYSYSSPSRVIRNILPLVDRSSVGNVSAGEDDLIQETILANTLEHDGQFVKVTAWGTVAANANNKRVKLYVGSAVVADTGAIAANDKDWRVSAYFYRNSATVAMSTSEGQFNGAILQTETTTFGGRDFTVNNIVKCTGEATSDDDILQQGLMVEFVDY